jgi:hypothetical protein
MLSVESLSGRCPDNGHGTTLLQYFFDRNMDLIRVAAASLDVNEAVAYVTHESAGAISTFIGITRDNFQGIF